MRNYELLVSIKPTLTEEELSAKIDSVKELIEKNGGQVASTQKLGMRELGYEILKNKRGYFVVYYYTAPATALTEIERINRLDEDLLRFMTVKYVSKKEIGFWNDLVSGKKQELRRRKEFKKDFNKPQEPRVAPEAKKEEK
jgi:small subunit ribosomal protein S6